MWREVGWVRWVGAEEVGGGATSDAKRQEVVVLVAERLQPAFEAALAPRRGRRRVEERVCRVRHLKLSVCRVRHLKPTPHPTLIW